MYHGAEELLDMQARIGETERDGKDRVAMPAERHGREREDVLRGVGHTFAGAVGVGGIRSVKISKR